MNVMETMDLTKNLSCLIIGISRSTNMAFKFLRVKELAGSSA